MAILVKSKIKTYYNYFKDLLGTERHIGDTLLSILGGVLNLISAMSLARLPGLKSG